MALVETCFSRLTGEFGDYSEQQFIDCGYGQNGAAGCDGAPPHAYVKYAAENAELGLLHESDYPYTNTQPTYTCPADLGGTLRLLRLETLSLTDWDLFQLRTARGRR